MIIIHPVLLKDIKEIEDMDVSFSTDRVWQMERKTEGEEVATTFRTIRLPRAVKVQVQGDRDWLVDWQNNDLFIVAEEEGNVAGYLHLVVDRSQNVGRICHLAVGPKKRRQGFGTALIQEAKRWAKVRRVRTLVAETQTKNYPAISFLQKSGFSFCGFNDSCFPSKDIAVFFVCPLI